MSEDAPRPASGSGGALLPADLLQADEQVEALIRPSAWFLVLFAWRRHLAALGVMLVTGYVMPEHAWVGLVALVLSFAEAWLQRVSRVYVLTDRRAIAIAGVLRVTTLALPRHRLQHSIVTRSFAEQLLGLGTVLLATAGTSGDELAWVNVRHPYKLQGLVDAGVAPTQDISA